MIWCWLWYVFEGCPKNAWAFGCSLAPEPSVTVCYSLAQRWEANWASCYYWKHPVNHLPGRCRPWTSPERNFHLVLFPALEMQRSVLCILCKADWNQHHTSFGSQQLKGGNTQKYKHIYFGVFLNRENQAPEESSGFGNWTPLGLKSYCIFQTAIFADLQ